MSYGFACDVTHARSVVGRSANGEPGPGWITCTTRDATWKRISPRCIRQRTVGLSHAARAMKRRRRTWCRKHISGSWADALDSKVVRSSGRSYSGSSAESRENAKGEARDDADSSSCSAPTYPRPLPPRRTPNQRKQVEFERRWLRFRRANANSSTSFFMRILRSKRPQMSSAWLWEPRVRTTNGASLASGIYSPTHTLPLLSPRLLRRLPPLRPLPRPRQELLDERRRPIVATSLRRPQVRRRRPDSGVYRYDVSGARSGQPSSSDPSRRRHRHRDRGDDCVRDGAIAGSPAIRRAGRQTHRQRGHVARAHRLSVGAWT